MRLADVRKLAVRKQFRIRFSLPNGMECVVSEHGIAQVPSLTGVPDFNLEEAIASARHFTLEPAASADKRKAAAPQRVTAEELASMTAAGGPEKAHHDDHDE